MQSPSTSDAYYNHASQLLDAMQPRINFHDATRYRTQQLYQKAQRPWVYMIVIFLFICLDAMTVDGQIIVIESSPIIIERSALNIVYEQLVFDWSNE